MSRAKSKRRGRQETPVWRKLAGNLRLWIATGWIAALGGAAYGLHALEPAARDLSATPSYIEWVDPPWLTWDADGTWAMEFDHLKADLEYYMDRDIFNVSCAAVGQMLSDSPWIDEVERVRKTRRGAVEVRVHARRPKALVEKYGMYLLISEEGVHLPRPSANLTIDTSEWFVIRGVASDPPEHGEVWSGDDLKAGLRMVDFLDRAMHAGRLPFHAWIKAIDVSNFERREDAKSADIKLITINPGSYINWGLAPGSEYEVDISATEKLNDLGKLFELFGQTLPAYGPIDVRFGLNIDAWREIAPRN